MSEDRPRRPRPGGSSSGGRPAGRGAPRPGSRGGSAGGASDGRSGGARPSGRPGARPGSRPGSRPSGRPDGRSSGRTDGRRTGRSDGRTDDRGNRRDDDRRGGTGRDGHRSTRPEPRNEAERRAAEVRAKRGPRRTPITPEGEQAKIENREIEQWIDDGSIHDEAQAATIRAAGRATGRDRDRRPVEVDPEVVAEIHDALDPQRAARLSERLASASAALDRERFEEARRMVTPLVRELPMVAAVHEVNGLASYRLGRWKQAAQSLEMARQLKADPSLLPVLADCYRALKRWNDVDAIWREVGATSPAHEITAEARIVVAGSLADRGDLKAAIALMQAAVKAPKRVRDHHLRQWYVLGDLYDRAGDTMTAARWFREIAQRDPAFADVRDRLRSLGR